jgi:hypothetical protein
MTNQILELFKTLIQRVNSSNEHQMFIQEWVGPYPGKILQLQTDKGAFHIILHQQGNVELQSGIAPSPDVIYQATSQTLMDLFTGKATFRELTKTWKLLVIGAGHESVPLARLILRVLQAT